jgi:hypothetical protein
VSCVISWATDMVEWQMQIAGDVILVQNRPMHVAKLDEAPLVSWQVAKVQTAIIATHKEDDLEPQTRRFLS